jgi:hypothetical protein
MASRPEKWENMAARTSAAAAKVKPPAKVAPSTARAYAAAQARLKNHLLNLVPAIKTAPIYLISTHGAYDLRSDPIPWVVPENTYIFETQSIGDTTLTSIDNMLWKLCLAEYRPAFLHYFMGNHWFFEKKGGAPLRVYTELFRNLILYKPGDIIYERDLTIGGGNKKEADGSARRSYVNMGFYKFDLTTPRQAPPKSTTPRPMEPTEIAEIDDLRTMLINDEDFTITNKQLVNMINNGEEIEYGGLQDGRTQLIPPQTFTYTDDGDPIKIYIFSSCASVNCNPAYPKVPKGTSKADEEKINAAYAKATVAAYKSKQCTDRMKIIETRQRDASLETLAMGIGTGPGGPGWNLDIESLEGLGIASRDLRSPKGAVGASSFTPADYSEMYAEIDEDVSNWWAIIGDDEGELPALINPKKQREILAGGKRTRRTNRKNRKTFKSRK